jgi:hypothetical protein
MHTEERRRPATCQGSLRTFSLLLSVWLLLLPQLALMGQDRMATNGPQSVLVEEEDVKHGTNASSGQVHLLRSHTVRVVTPPANEVLHRSHQGDVPHLPPWP